MEPRQRFMLGVILFVIGLIFIIFAGNPLNNALIGLGLPQQVHIVIGVVLAIVSLFLFAPTGGR